MKQSLRSSRCNNPTVPHAACTEQLRGAYAAERKRLAAFAADDLPQGDYENPVFGEGTAPNRLLLLGEAPGAEEAASGRPFVGKAGKQLDALLDMAGIDRKDVYISNIVKYRPVIRSEKSVRNRTPGKEEVSAGLALVKLEIEQVRPDWIVTLGNTPLKAVLQLAGEATAVIGDLHGTAKKIVIDEQNILLWPLYHPASGIYNRSLLPVMEQDARQFGEKLVKGR